MSKYYLKTLFILLVAFAPFVSMAQLRADFTADKTVGCGSLGGVQFTDQSTGNVVSRTWRFGNGNTSNLANPTANFVNIGSYNITLIVSDGNNVDSITKTSFINVYANPVANFNFNPNGGCSPLDVQFTNTSTSNSPIANYIWDFGDGSPAGAAANPLHTYLSGGSYSPSLEVIDQNGCKGTVVKNSAITVTAAPVAAFSASNPTVACSVPYTVNFQNNSTGVNLRYLWRFGDGNTSNQASPSHTYTNFGRYTVTLEITDSNCGDTLVRLEYIRIENTRANFSLPKSVYCLGDTLRPQNTSTGSTFHRWEFSDGSAINQFEPEKVLNQAGKLSIRLIASAGAQCTDEIIDSIEVEQLISDFTTSDSLLCFGDTVNFTPSANVPANFTWRIGSGMNSDTLFEDTLTYRINSNGLFDDTLITISLNGCRDTVIYPNNRKIDVVRGRMAVNGRVIDEDTLKGCLPLTYDFQDSSTSVYPITQWKWDFDDGVISNLRDPMNITFTQKKIYGVVLEVTDSLGCKSGDVHYVLGGNQAIPRATVFPDTLCQEDSLLIIDTSTPVANIDSFWYVLREIGGGDEIRVGVDTPGVKIPVSGICGDFSISMFVIENGCDSVLLDFDTIHVEGPVAEPTFGSNCVDRQTVQFTANAKDYTRFYWDFGDGSPLDSINLNPTHFYSLFRTYLARLILINDTNGCDTNIYELFVPIATLPPLNIRPDTMEYCPGDSISFFNQDFSFYVYTKWILDGDSISNRDSVSFVLDSAGTYPIVLETEDVFGCIYRVRDTIYISQPKAKIGSEILVNCSPLEVIFIDSSFSDTTIGSWFWDFGNGQTSTQARDTITLPTNQPNDIFLKVRNIFGCEDSTQLTNFLNNQILNVDFRFGDVTLCTGDSVRFRNTSSGLNPNFSWDFGDGTAVSTNDEWVTHIFNTPGIFTIQLTATDEIGCTITKTEVDLVSVDTLPQADFMGDTLTAPCPPLAVNFTDLTVGNVNQWRWILDQNDPSRPVVQNAFKNYTQPGSYDVSLWVSTPNGCVDSINKAGYIQVGGPNATIQISPNQACIGDSVTFTATGSSQIQNFFWDFGDGNGASGNPVKHAYDTTGVLFPSLVVEDASGCQVSVLDTFEIFNIRALFELTEDTLCTPANVPIINRSLGASNYQWFFGDGGQSNNANPNYVYQTSGTYNIQLIINSVQGCIDTAEQFFTAAPQVQLVSTPDTSVCLGDSLVLSGSGAVNYSWTPSALVLSPKASTTIAFPSTDTTFQLIGNNAFNCADTNRIFVSVIGPPSSPSLQDTTLIIGESVGQTAFVGNGFNYLWTPPDGIDCPTCPNPTFSPQQSRTYFLRIADNAGCFELIDSVFINVLERYSLDVPQVFSPNGDGINDVIFAKGWGLKELLAFRIYNRFGELVFESTDFNIGWDGTYKGEAQNIENYVYTVEALTFGGEVLRKKGNINLIR